LFQGRTRVLREEGREYVKLAIHYAECVLAAINAAGGVDIFIMDGSRMMIKRDVEFNPVEAGEIFWSK
jgi:hypothetical protein